MSSTLESRHKGAANRSDAGPRPSTRRETTSPLRHRAVQGSGKQGRFNASASMQRQHDRGVQVLQAEQISYSALVAHHHKDRFADDAFEELRKDIEHRGRNLIPVLVRPSGLKVRVGESELPQYELVYGHRRVRACERARVPVHALVRDVDDLELVTLMHAENALRQGVSAYERGKLYDRLIAEDACDLQDHPFRSQADLAKTLRIDAGDVSRCRFLARLPGAVLDVIESPRELAIHDADRLRPVLEVHPDEVLRRAARIHESEGRLPAKEVIRRLTDLSAKPPKNPVLQSPILAHATHCGHVNIDAAHCLSVQLTVPMSNEQAERFKIAVERALEEILPPLATLSQDSTLDGDPESAPE